MLPHSKRGTDGAIRSVDGGIAGHFITALELAQERAREAAARQEEKAMALTTEQIYEESQTRWIDRLLEAALRNPSLAGRDLAMEIIERGPAPEPGERIKPPDNIRDSLRSRSLDDSNYHTQIEHAGALGKHSKELRDLYERGSEIKDDTLIIPAEEYEIPDERDRYRVINISHAFDKIRDPKTAVEFHSLALAIAGETADTWTEIKVFKHYYDLIERAEGGRRLDRHSNDYERELAAALDRTLAEMRVLAWEMAKRETRESIDIVPSITERSYVYRYIQDYDRASEFYVLAQAIAGTEADLQKETQVFSYFYGKLDRDEEGHRLAPDNEAGRLEAVERTLAVMRQAVEQRADMPEFAGAAHTVVSLDEAAERGRSPEEMERGDSREDEEDHAFTYDAPDFEAGDDTDDFEEPEYEYTLEEAYGEREAEAAAWQFNTAARKVNLGGERLRFPQVLTAATREWLIETKLPEIDRRIQNGAGLYDKRDNVGSVLERGVLSNANRLIRPERDEILRKVSEAAGLAGDELKVRPPGPDELAEARRILLELCAYEKSKLERRRELRSRLVDSDGRYSGEDRVNAAPDRSYISNDHTASRLGRVERLIEGLQNNLVETSVGRGSLNPSESGRDTLPGPRARIGASPANRTSDNGSEIHL